MIEVEKLAARRGLEVVVETGFRNIVLESDSQILITAVREDSYSLARRAKSLSQFQVWMEDVPPDSSSVFTG